MPLKPPKPPDLNRIQLLPSVIGGILARENPMLGGLVSDFGAREAQREADKYQTAYDRYQKQQRRIEQRERQQQARTLDRADRNQMRIYVDRKAAARQVGDQAGYAEADRQLRDLQARWRKRVGAPEQGGTGSSFGTGSPYGDRPEPPKTLFGAHTRPLGMYHPDREDEADRNQVRMLVDRKAAARQAGDNAAYLDASRQLEDVQNRWRERMRGQSVAERAGVAATAQASPRPTSPDFPDRRPEPEWQWSPQELDRRYQAQLDAFDRMRQAAYLKGDMREAFRITDAMGSLRKNWDRWKAVKAGLPQPGAPLTPEDRGRIGRERRPPGVLAPEEHENIRRELRPPVDRRHDPPRGTVATVLERQGDEATARGDYAGAARLKGMAGVLRQRPDQPVSSIRDHPAIDDDGRRIIDEAAGTMAPPTPGEPGGAPRGPGYVPPAAPPVPDYGRNRAVPGDGYVFPVEGYSGKVDLHHGSHAGGSDIFAPPGTPVRAMRGGQVIGAGYTNVGGNYVMVRADDGNVYYYAHLKDAPHVRQGQTIRAGDLLGGVGETGNAKGTRAHLHIGIGPDIVSGVGPAGGTGGDFDAVGLLRQALEAGHYTGDGHDHGPIEPMLPNAPPGFIPRERATVRLDPTTGREIPATMAEAGAARTSGIESYAPGGADTPDALGPIPDEGLRPTIARAARESGLQPALIAGVIEQESTWKPRQRSPAGAGGYMQMMPATARSLGVTNVDDPDQNIRGGSRYLKQQIDAFEDLELGLAAYNWGPGNVSKALRQTGGKSWQDIEHLAPRETREYVPSVIRRSQKYRGR